MQENFDELSIICRCVSTQRLERYQKHGFTVLEVYAWDIELSESLYPLLHIIEIGFRNRLHDEIAIILNDDEWLLNRNRLLLERLELHWLGQIDSSIMELRKQSKLDEGHLLAELNFGFWTSLLGGAFESNNFLWPKLKNKVFPEAHGINVANIRNRFSQIRKLRNRIFHHESIWHLKDLLKSHDQIIDAIRWIEPGLLKLIQVDRFPSIYAKGPDVKK